MASKRKAVPNSSTNRRKSKKKESDFDDSLSDDGSDHGNGKDIEVLIASDEAEPDRLPPELLKTLEKQSGKMLIAGMVTWDAVGKKDTRKVTKIRPNLFSFHRFTDETYRFAKSHSSSGHTIMINSKGQAITFGRNISGQLGHNDTKCLEIPTVVSSLSHSNIISGAVGRHHTLFLTDSGTVYACGENKSGQCGVGNTQSPILVPTKINYRGPPIIRVGCGAEFSVILDITGNLYTFGLPEYGQLGHNTDGKYFVNANKLTFHFETSPKKVPLFIEKSKDGHITPVENVQIVDFSCGNNHTVAIDSKKRAFSWGFGGFGRLGHAEQRDEMVPRLIKAFDNTGRGVKSIYCGATYSLSVSEVGALYLFGQNKKTGEANMYPKPVNDLLGWHITDIGCSNTSIMISADDSLIAWGASPTYGELGLGSFQKSSAIPKEVPKFRDLKLPQCTTGYSHTILLVNTEHEQTKIAYDAFPEYKIED